MTTDKRIKGETKEALFATMLAAVIWSRHLRSVVVSDPRVDVVDVSVDVRQRGLQGSVPRVGLAGRAEMGVVRDETDPLHPASHEGEMKHEAQQSHQTMHADEVLRVCCWFQKPFRWSEWLCGVR